MKTNKTIKRTPCTILKKRKENEKLKSFKKYQRTYYAFYFE